MIPLTHWHSCGHSWPATGVRGDPDSQKPWLLLKPAGRCSLSPASPAGIVPPLTCLCVCLPIAVCPFVRPSVRQAGEAQSLSYKNGHWFLKGSEVFVLLNNMQALNIGLISKINEENGPWKAICSHESFIGWRVLVPTLADEWLMATCCCSEPFYSFWIF